MQGFFQRMIGAARVDVATYEEVEHDGGATGQAAIVVIAAAIAVGIGTLSGDTGIVGLIWTSVFALIGWLIWAALIWLVGTKMLPETQTEADVGQLLRTIGFAAAPGILRIFELIPLIGFIVALVVAIWMLVTMVVAVRQALDYESTGRAIGVCIIAWLIQWGVLAIIVGITGVEIGGSAAAGGLI